MPSSPRREYKVIEVCLPFYTITQSHGKKDNLDLFFSILVLICRHLMMQAMLIDTKKNEQMRGFKRRINGLQSLKMDQKMNQLRIFRDGGADQDIQFDVNKKYKQYTYETCLILLSIFFW